MSPLESYVGDLGRALRGPRRLKHDLLCEARDHLVDASEAFQTSGLPRDAAERRAVSDFGPVRDIAPGYQAILSSGHSRRIAFGLLVVTLVQPLAWGIWTAETPATSANGVQAELDQVIETVGAVTMGVALLAALLGGIGVRHLGVRTRVIRSTCITTLALSTAIVLVSAAMNLTSTSPSVPGAIYTLAVAIVPFGFVAGNSARCLRGLDRARDLDRPRMRA